MLERKTARRTGQVFIIGIGLNGFAVVGASVARRGDQFSRSEVIEDISCPSSDSPMEEKEILSSKEDCRRRARRGPPHSVTMAASFTKDLGADPVDVIELEFALGEEFGIEIPDVDAEKITTVGEAVSYIKAVG